MRQQARWANTSRSWSSTWSSGPAPATADADITVQRLGEGSFAVNGRGIERLLGRYDINNEDALAYLEERLRKIGVLDALAARGVRRGRRGADRGGGVRAGPGDVRVA